MAQIIVIGTCLEELVNQGKKLKKVDPYFEQLLRDYYDDDVGLIPGHLLSILSDMLMVSFEILIKEVKRRKKIPKEVYDVLEFYHEFLESDEDEC